MDEDTPSAKAPTSARSLARGFLPACLVGAAGGLAFHLLGLPAAWMSGSLVAVAIAAFMGMPVVMPGVARSAVFIVLGAVMGAAVTPETLRLMASWPGSMAGLAVLIPAIVVAIMVYLIRIERWDRESAFYAAVPGAMSYVMAMTLASRADARAVTVVQSVRLVLLVAALPSAIVLAGLGQSRPPPPVAVAAAWFELPLLAAASAAVGIACERLGVPGGATLGAMIASAVLHGTGLVTASMPQAVVVASFVLIGVLIAERFAGTSLRELRVLARAAFGAFVVGTAVSIVVAAAVSWATGLGLGKMVLAYAPGGIEAMAVLAFVLDQDPAFVGAHHIVRFVAIALMLPFVAGLAVGRNEG